MTALPEAAPRHDLSTPAGRRRAWAQLLFTDHGLLRLGWSNFHWISPEMARANQPSPWRIARYAAMGFKTIVNLRGVNDSGHYLLEREACARHGLALVDFTAKSRDAPSREVIHGAKRLFAEIAYPALMHCKSGADRAGLMAVLYRHFRLGEPIEAALEGLSGRYGHIRQGKTGVIDYAFARYLAANAARPIAFLDWVDSAYDPAAVKREFLSSWWANVLVDRVLRRE